MQRQPYQADKATGSPALAVKLRELTTGACWLELWRTGDLIFAFLYKAEKSAFARGAADFLIRHWGIQHEMEFSAQNYPPKREKWHNPGSFLREDAFYASEKLRVFVENAGDRRIVSLQIPAGQVLALDYSGQDCEARSSDDAARLAQFMRLPKPNSDPTLYQEGSW